MDRDEINRIILDNELFHGTMALGVVMDADHLEKFANLVAAAERERIKWDTIHSCHPECDKPVCVAIRKAVLEEREACAKLCDEKVAAEYATGKVDHNEIGWTQACAIAIRAGGDALAKLNQAAEDDGEPL
jgi:hypothetical protein